MCTRDFIIRNIEKSRQQMRASEFISLSTNSLQLSGKSPEAFLAAANIANRSRKSFEIVLLEDSKNIARLPGDLVTEADIFNSSENVVWENEQICFITPEGIQVSSYQYDYIVRYGLGSNQLFARSNNRDSDVVGTWKTITRKASEARKDKAKEILYITIGSIEWLTPDAKKQMKPTVSPLFFCSAREESNSKDKPRFKVVGEAFKVNTILGREIKKQLGVDIFENCEKEFSFDQVTSILEQIKENVSGSPTNIRFRKDDLNICILDSSNETICQAVEKELNTLCESELLRVFAGEKDYVPNPNIIGNAIYPLPADDSQREVIAQALSGNSVNVSAAAGTGKSQTMVNIAANMVVKGKSVCVMSEKAAANEVFIKYARTVGLDKYCLIVNNKMSVPEIIGQIKNIVNIPALYADAARAREVLQSKHEIEEEFAQFHHGLYSNIPDININLYTLIGEALEYAPGSELQYLSVDRTRYVSAKHKLLHLQNSILKTMSDNEFSSLLATGNTGDSELDHMLLGEFTKLRADGIDIIAYIKENNCPKDQVAGQAISNISRIIALDMICEQRMFGYGNRRLKAMYSRLTDIYTQMTAIYMAFMVQQISARMQKIVKDTKFVELLDKLKGSRITLLELFKIYGKDILQLCPIIVTTPATAVNYITKDMNTFDILMIDEASQVPITSVIPFLVEKRQLIAFGDNMQLDITSFFLKNDSNFINEDEEFDLSLADKSILHVVQGKIPNCQLKYHYRSKTEHLLKISNMKCYDNTLNIIPDVYIDRGALPDWLGYEVIKLDDPEIAANGSNLSEARAIADSVVKIKLATSEKSIGIIAFNEKQQNAIIDELEDRQEKGILDCDLDNDNDIWIRSLENAQGKEADVIMISIGHFARNKKDGAIRKSISDLNKPGGENRLNVLFTRAREKNIIYISFDYRELKDVENSGLSRLFQYLDYAITGSTPQNTNSQILANDRLNANAAKIIRSITDDVKVYTKVGQNDLMVDLAMTCANDKKYELGLLLSEKALTPNTLYTKVNTLERAGWNVVPVSPIYLLDQQKRFEEQTLTALLEPSKLGSSSRENYLSSIASSEPLKPYEIGDQSGVINTTEKAPKKEIKPLTLLELRSIDFLSIYASVIDKDIYECTTVVLTEKARSGVTQATLLLMIYKLPQFIDQGRIQEVIVKTNLLYNTKGEKRACYLLAQLLRTQEDFETNEGSIVSLLNEATGIGILI